MSFAGIVLNRVEAEDDAVRAGLQELARSVRRQAWRRLAAADAELDRTQRFSQATWDELVQLGIIGLSFPESEGGGGAPALALVVALEQIAYASAVAALYPGTTIQVDGGLLRAVR